MTVARGEIWWSDHPAAGRRPVLVLTRDAKGLLTEPITKLGPERMNEVCRALNAATGC